jgi:iron complex outermembrane recepter protein
VLDNVFDTRAGLNITDQEVEAYGGALNIAIKLTDTLTFKSITAYREDKSTTRSISTALPAVDLDVPAIYNNDQFSQELQLLYEGDGCRACSGSTTSMPMPSPLSMWRCSPPAGRRRG